MTPRTTKHRVAKKAFAVGASAALAAAPLVLLAPAAAAQTSTTYVASLRPLNHAAGSGHFMLKLSGDHATVTESVTGLASTFMGAPYPHVQHIHGGAEGHCPSTSADKNGDGVVSTVEGQPAYGAIQTTLSTSGDTSPAAGTNVKTAPSGASFRYSRSITLDSKTLDSLKSGKAVVVVHGLDPSTLSKQAQDEKSELVPSLPLAATSPALCGVVETSQMSQMPAGAANTGGGASARVEQPWLFAAGGLALLGAAGTLIVWRRGRAGEN